MKSNFKKNDTPRAKAHGFFSSFGGVKSSEAEDRHSSTVLRLWSSAKEGKLIPFFFILILVVFIFSLSLYNLYFSSERNDFLNRKINSFMAKHEKIRFSLRKIIKIIDTPFYFYAAFFPDNLDNYNLAIKSKDFQELQDNLSSFIKDKNPESFKKEVSAEFKKGNDSIKAKVRYRGDNPNHWAFEKKSWRIKFETPFEGKEAIDLILPEDREYFLEIFSNNVARKMGLLVPEMKFINLFVNNQRQGVYLMAEHWSKSFLEKKGYIGESDLFGEGNLDTVSYLYETPANFQKYLKDTNSKVDNFIDLQILLDYLNKLDDENFYKKIEEILDLENFLTWEAHSTLMFSRAQRDTHNAVLLFNKEKGKFQFVPWNAFMGDYDINNTPIDVDFNSLATRILKNPLWLHQRNKILWQYLSNQENGNEDFRFYQSLLKQTKRDFYKDSLKLFTDLEFLSRTKKHQERLTLAYEKIKEELQKSQANVYLRQKTKPNNYSETIATLELESKDFSSINIKSFEVEFEATPSANFSFFRDINKNSVFDKGDILIGDFEKTSDRKFLIKPSGAVSTVHTERELYKGVFYPITSREVFFVVSSQPFFIKNIDIKIDNAVTGKKANSLTTRFLDESVFRYLERLNMDQAEFSRIYPFFKTENQKNIILPAGTYIIKEPIIIPSGLNLEIQPGAILKFSKEAFLLSYSPIKAEGTKERPIIFTNLEEGKPWGVLALVDKGASNSIFKNIIVEETSPVYINGIFFSGGLAAHYAEVKISDSVFQRNHGDDALNVKHAKAEIKNCQFLKNDFDAIDFDVTDGMVEGNLFDGNGNDAFDISFSKAHFKNNKVKNSGDKCVSVGENSQPEIYDNDLEGCIDGVAVKDLSEAKIYNNKISHCKIAITAYQKKAFFGGGKALIRNNQLADNEKDFEKDQVSKIEGF